MTDVNYVLLYVQSPTDSAAFYSGLFGRPPVESSATFAMFAMQSGVMLGLWARDTVEPQPNGGTGGSEICFSVADAKAVDATHSDWQKRGLKIAQKPTAMDFGRTFVALDPDGHRLRVFAPAVS
jgi:predicted enzyme related to lactoylglutathione lyase